MYSDMGHTIKLHVYTDAEAARGIASRLGLGKTRHIATHFLWLQERVAAGDMVVNKINGSEHLADLLTKHVARDLLLKFTDYIALKPEAGRAAECPELPAGGLGMLVFPQRSHAQQ